MLYLALSQVFFNSFITIRFLIDASKTWDLVDTGQSKGMQIQCRRATLPVGRTHRRAVGLQLSPTSLQMRK